MKKIFALGIMLIAISMVVTCVFADEGETEALSTVAPAIIQAPPAAEAPVAIQKASAPVQTRPSAAVGIPVQMTRTTAAPGSARVRGDTNLRTAEPDYVVGSVSCVVPSSLMQPKSKLVVSDQSGNEIEFTVKTLAVIYDPTGCIMSLDKLQQGTKVQVNYKAAGANTKIATSVKVLK